MPKISIIVPVYKVEQYLCRCLDSIVAQTFADWECILVDDGSPDNSGKICDEYAEKDERFRVFHQENAGVSAARNKGLDEAKGEWITFVDSDDWVELNTYETVFTNFSDNVDIVCFRMKFYYSDEHIKIVPFENKGDIYYKFQHYRVYMHSPCNKIFRKAILFGKKFNNSIKIFEDLLFNYDIFTDNSINIKFLDSVLYSYRVISENSSRLMVIDNEKIEQTCKAYFEICNLNEKKNISKDSYKYIRFFSTRAALPYINDLKYFNPIKFRNICIKWSFYNYRPDLFLLFLFAFLKLDFFSNSLLKIKKWIKTK